MTSITDYGVAFPRFMSKESVAICSAVSSVYDRRAIDCRPLSLRRRLIINHAICRRSVSSDYRILTVESR